ncbi:hypothetical protein AWENTII_005558 [Aspergillus wentii]
MIGTMYKVNPSYSSGSMRSFSFDPNLALLAETMQARPQRSFQIDVKAIKSFTFQEEHMYNKTKTHATIKKQPGDRDKSVWGLRRVSKVGVISDTSPLRTSRI